MNEKKMDHASEPAGAPSDATGVVAEEPVVSTESNDDESSLGPESQVPDWQELVQLTESDLPEPPTPPAANCHTPTPPDAPVHQCSHCDKRTDRAATTLEEA